MTDDGIDRLLEEGLRRRFEQLQAETRPGLARYRATSRTSRLTRLLPALPAVLAGKGAIAGLTVALAAAGGTTAAIVGASHHSAGTALSTPSGSGGHALLAGPQGVHGRTVTGAVSSCSPGPDFGRCVAAVASEGRSHSHPTAAPGGQLEGGAASTAPPGSLPTPPSPSPLTHPTEPASPSPHGPPTTPPAAPAHHPGR